MQLEGFSVHLPHVLLGSKPLQVCLQVLELAVVTVSIVADNWNSVINLECKRENRVINDSYVAHLFVENSQIFDKQALTINTGVAVKAGLDQLASWV